MDSAAKVASMPTPSAAETDSPTGKDKIACMGSYEKSTKPFSREDAEICVLLKPDLLENMDACAKFVDGVRMVVYPSFFTKHATEFRKITLFAMMQKTAIPTSKVYAP